MLSSLLSYFPIINTLKSYKKSIFLEDLSAGMIVGIMLIPQGMAYAFLAGLPPVYGLYGGLIPLVLYAIFGTSRQMSIGPVAISSLLILAGVSQLAPPFSVEYVHLVILAGLMIGVLQMILGLFRGGNLVNFISHPVITGFTAAAAIIIAISQLKDILGIAIPRFDYSFQTLLYAIENIPETNWLALAMSIGGMAIMIGLKYWKKSLPYALIIVILSIGVTALLRLNQSGLEIVGDIPKGLPPFHVPQLSLSKITQLFPIVLTVTVICIVESISIAKLLENKHQDYIIRPNQELIALGVSKIGGAFFWSLPTSGSFTRSAVNDEAGAKTTMSGIFAALLIMLTLLFLTPLFYFLPKATLAAIILLAVRKLFDYQEAIHLWKTHRPDFYLMLVTFTTTLVFGIQEGVFAGIFLSLLVVLYRSSRPNIVVLGNIPGTTYYRNIKRFDQAEQIEGKLIVRFENQLYYGNASYFKSEIQNLVQKYPGPLEELLIDAKSIHYIDSSGLKALTEIHSFLYRRKIRLGICAAVGVVRDQLKTSGFMSLLGEDRHFIYLHHAIERPEEEGSAKRDEG